MSLGQYILDDNGQPQLCDDTLTWGKWFQTAERHVAKDKIDGVTVSTVFLGLDHSFGGDVPILYETMIFGGIHDQFQNRYETREQALEGHKIAVEMVLEAKA